MDMVHSKCFGSFMQPARDSCPICTPHADRIMIATTATDMSISITPYATHTFLGKSQQALASTPRTVTSENMIELIKLWHARLGGLSFKRLQALAKLHPSVLKIPLQASFNESCHCCQRSTIKKGAAPPSVSREVSPLEEVHFDIFYLQRTLHRLPDGSRQPSKIHIFRRQEIRSTKSPAAILD